MKALPNFLLGLLLLSGGVSAIAVGCGSPAGNNGGPDAGPPLVSNDGGNNFFNGDDGGGSGNGNGGDGAINLGPLAIMPTTPTVNVTSGQAPMTVQFSATVGGVATGVAWSIDRGELGSIDSNGLFTPMGNLGGTGTITASYGSESVTTTITVNLTSTQNGDPAWSPLQADGGAAFDGGGGGYGGVGGDGPGAQASPAQVAILQSAIADGGAAIPDAGAGPDSGAGNDAGAANGGVSILYPYDGTVWPQGLLAPLLQWNPGSHSFDSVAVTITEKNFSWTGYFAANKAPFVNLPIPEPAWDAATLSNSGDPMQISIVFGESGTAYGPYTESWTIAQATLQGTIYYNSYGTAYLTNSDGLDHYGRQYGAGTLAINTGATAPVPVAGVNSVGQGGIGCRVCHTVSADGKTLVTQASNATASDYTVTEYVNLKMDTTMGSGTPLSQANLAFPALYKDSSMLLSGSGGMIDGDTNTRLYSLPNGTPLSSTGLGTGLKATLPAFSPDGAHVSFVFWSGSFSTTLTGDQKSLALLDFDGTSAFSNPRVVYTPPSGTSVTYSSFLPNSAGVVFEVELSNPHNEWGYTRNGITGELWWLDTASGVAHRLDQLNGYTSTGSVYLPGNSGGAATHTGAQDVVLNYEPTVNPIASGGYAWVVFTSRRMYGNVAQLGPWVSDPRKYAWLDSITDKKLWVAAIDLNAPAGTDPSHPAFYLPAQEIHAGNARGYWSVAACHNDGTSCQTGTQCCGGYCQQGDGGLVCSSTKPMCAATYDKCMTTSDCCGAQQGIQCINDVCTLNQPPVIAK